MLANVNLLCKNCLAVVSRQKGQLLIWVSGQTSGDKVMTNNNTTFTRKFSLFIATCCLFFGIATSANAGLVGQDVTGVLNFSTNTLNLFDPANTGFPQGSLNETSNPVTVATPGLEFAYVVDNAVYGVFANFIDTGVIITADVVVPPASSWNMTFTSSAFIGLTLLEVSDDFVNGGVSSSLVGNTLTFEWAGTSLGPDTFNAVYSLQAVPLPAALPLFAFALAGFGFFGWRRSRAAV